MFWQTGCPRGHDPLGRPPERSPTASFWSGTATEKATPAKRLVIHSAYRRVVHMIHCARPQPSVCGCPPPGTERCCGPPLMATGNASEDKFNFQSGDGHAMPGATHLVFSSTWRMRVWPARRPGLARPGFPGFGGWWLPLVFPSRNRPSGSTFRAIIGSYPAGSIQEPKTPYCCFLGDRAVICMVSAETVALKGSQHGYV